MHPTRFAAPPGLSHRMQDTHDTSYRSFCKSTATPRARAPEHPGAAQCSGVRSGSGPTVGGGGGASRLSCQPCVCFPLCAPSPRECSPIFLFGPDASFSMSSVNGPLLQLQTH